MKYLNSFPAMLLFLHVVTFQVIAVFGVDVAFVLYNSFPANEFAFVALETIPEGTVIYITDIGFDHTRSSFGRDTEGIIQWKATSQIKPGEVVTLQGERNEANVGEIELISDSFIILTDQGDQLYVYTSLDNGFTPDRFITAINNKGDGIFQEKINEDPTSLANTGELPSELSLGGNAVALEEKKFIKYNGIIKKGRSRDIKEAINNKDNWIGDDEDEQELEIVFVIDNEEGDDSGDDSNSNIGEFFEKVEGYFENPFVVIGTAAGTGMILAASVFGLIMRRKKRVQSHFSADLNITPLDATPAPPQNAPMKGPSMGWFDAIYHSKSRNREGGGWFSNTFGNIINISRSRDELPRYNNSNFPSTNVSTNNSAFEDVDEAETKSAAPSLHDHDY